MLFVLFPGNIKNIVLLASRPVNMATNVTEEAGNIASALLISYIIIIFYFRSFRWQHFSLMKFPFTDNMTLIKFIVCFLLVFFCLRGDVQSKTGANLIAITAIPQLRRGKGQHNQKLRVIIGPLTPVLAFNNFANDCSAYNTGMAILSFVAFVVLRPDNTEALDLLHRFHLCPLAAYRVLQAQEKRKRMHGILAASNACLAFVSGILLPSLDKIQSLLPLMTSMGFKAESTLDIGSFGFKTMLQMTE